MEQNYRDPEIWKMAHERAGFKMHLVIFFIAIAFMWLVWAFIGYINDWAYSHMWPVYPMLGWALGLLLHYLYVYRWKKKITVKEYEKLMNKKIR